MMRKFGVVFGVAAATLVGCAAEKHTAPPPAAVAASGVKQGDGTLEYSDVVTARATVTAINYKKRTVTLRGAEGEEKTIQVGPEVQNLAQVKKGDVVTASYHESVALKLKKPGEADPGVTEASGMERAKPGEMPAASTAKTVTVTATIVKVDRKKQVVTLKGPQGKVVKVSVADPARLAKVSEGDLVQITYTQALAISVEKAPKN